ncbi:MAG: hypothetical protein K6C34_03435, partial [Alphaproteobacteria bacterium]|nr:hypothetical protein [Alphaproteobacteria bacterium]
MQKKCSVVFGVYSDGSLSKSAKEADKLWDGAIEKTVKKLEFSGELFKSCKFVPCCDDYKYIVLIGLGEKGKKFTGVELEKLGAAVYSCTANLDEDVNVMICAEDVNVPCNSASSLIGFGALLKSWNFDKYKPSKNKQIKLKNLVVLTHDLKVTEDCFKKLHNLAEGIFLTRTVVAEPSNVIYPESLAKIAKDELEPLG